MRLAPSATALAHPSSHGRECSGARAGTPSLLWLMALAPPPSGVAVFAELVRSGGPVAIDAAEMRAIGLGHTRGVSG